MIVLMIGDIVGDAGCAHVRKVLPGIKSQFKADVVIANGENAAQGNGILPTSAQMLFDCGIDIITTGNHGLRRKEIKEVLDREKGVIRPANYHPDAPGSGTFLYDHPRFQLLVINLQGVTYMSMQPSISPYDSIDEILSKNTCKNIIVDFHAEATAEKLCMAYYLDGRVSAVIGTHTHVPTADAQILPGGTGYRTDIGMCGGYRSVLGVKVDQALYRMRTGLPTRFEPEPSDCRLSGVVMHIDESNGKCVHIESIFFM